MQASRQPEQSRKYHQWGFRLKWKTLPRVISDSMAQMLHVPIQLGLDNKRGWAMDDEYRSEGYLRENIMPSLPHPTTKWSTCMCTHARSDEDEYITTRVEGLEDAIADGDIVLIERREHLIALPAELRACAARSVVVAGVDNA